MKENDNNRKKFSFSQFRQLVFTLGCAIRLVAKIDKRLLVVILILNSFWGFSSLPIFCVDKLLIDKLVSGLGNIGYQAALHGLFFLLFIRVTLDILRNFVGDVSVFLRYMLSRRVTNEMDVLIGEKIFQLDLAMIESPEFRDKFSKIERESGRRLWGLMMPISNISNYLVGIISSSGILFFFSPWIVAGSWPVAEIWDCQDLFQKGCSPFGSR